MIVFYVTVGLVTSIILITEFEKEHEPPIGGYIFGKDMVYLQFMLFSFMWPGFHFYALYLHYEEYKQTEDELEKAELVYKMGISVLMLAIVLLVLAS